MATKNPSGAFHAVHDIRVDELEQQKPGDNGILIEIAQTGICGSDLHYYHETLLPVGTVIGHEFCGTIIEVGKNVTDMKVGQRVSVNPAPKGVGFGPHPGGFAKYITINDAEKGVDVFPLADSITNAQGAFVEPLTICISAAKLAEFTPETNVVITGIGPIGMVTLLLLKSQGINNIMVSDVLDSRLEMAKKHGAAHVHNPKTDGSLTDALIKAFGTTPALMEGVPDYANAHVAIDCSGVSAVIQECIEAIAPDGTVILVGLASPTAPPFSIHPTIAASKKIKIHGAWRNTPEDFQDAVNLTASGEVDLTPLITHEFPMSQLPEAFKVAAEDRSAVKVMVVQE